MLFLIGSGPSLHVHLLTTAVAVSPGGLPFSRTLWTVEYFYLAIHFIRNAYGSALQS